MPYAVLIDESEQAYRRAIDLADDPARRPLVRSLTILAIAVMLGASEASVPPPMADGPPPVRLPR